MTRTLVGIILLLCVVLSANAQDSLNISCVSKIDYWQDADDIQIVGHLAYAVSSGSGFHILDLTDPVHPVEIGRYLLPEGDCYSGGLFVTGNLAYLALGTGIIVLDISDPTHPIALNEPFGSCYGDIIVHDGFAMVTDVSGDVIHPAFLSVSNPDSIYTVIVDTPDFYRCAVLIGIYEDYFCVFKNTAQGNLFTLLRLDSTQQPQTISECNTGVYIYNGTIAGNYAYLTSTVNGVSIVDLSNPQEPVMVGHCNSGGYFSPAVVEGRAIIARDDTTLEVWNVNDPTNTFLEGSCSTGNPFSCIAAFETAVYLANRYCDHPITIANIAQPSAPSVIGEYGTCGFPDQLTTNGTIAYLADHRFAVRTIDLWDPVQAQEVGRDESSHAGAHDIAVKDHRAYLACSNGWFIYDVGLPAQPVAISSVNYPCFSPNVVIRGDYAYTSKNLESVVSGYLLVYSLEDTVSPVCVDSIWNTDLLSCFTAGEDYLYLVSGNTTLIIFSLADPAIPVQVGSLSLPVRWITDLAVVGRFVYAATSEESIYVVDVSVPSAPTQFARIQEPAACLDVRGNLLAIGMQEGLKVLNVSDPQNPSSLGFYANHDAIKDVQFYDSYILTVSSAQFGVFTFDSLAGVRPRTESTLSDYMLYPCYPNPFNPGTQIAFNLPKAEHVKLLIYDIAGRLVRTLINERVPAGTHTLQFDGSNLSSGVYLCRMETSGYSKTQKMMLVK